MTEDHRPVGHQPGASGPDPDNSLGAVEGEKPSDPQPGNRNAPGVDSQGRPSDPVKTDQDRIGANLDETEG
ncbi:MAG: hypothetical protein M3R55_05940 [Acidobacteriota bacterium]|nr:hypothetical protein [Acidobacteriota bacterium]